MTDPRLLDRIIDAMDNPPPRRKRRRQYDWRRDYIADVAVDHTPWGPIRRLIVERRSGGDGITWDTLQRIKNDMLGRDVVAIEVFPAHVDLVYERNRRHLWEWPDDKPMPFNLLTR